MKKIFQLLAFFLFTTSLHAQILDSIKLKPEVPTYVRIPEIPPFNITLVSDSSQFSKADLQKKRKTLIFIFSPSCEHCIKATEDLIANYDKFKNINIVMATTTAYFITNRFYIDHNIQNYPNIKMGVDSKYFLGTFYSIKVYPAIFLYDKKGMFKHRFETKDTMETIAKKL